MVFALILIILLTSSCSFTQATSGEQKKIVRYDGHTLYVGGSGPGNYSSIQEAIDNTTDGDTVFVYDDSSPYLETVSIYTSIQLLGENNTTTRIEGADRAISIFADHVTVSGFMITECGGFWHCAGIYINSDENTIVGNNVIDNYQLNGLFLDHASFNTIENNTIMNNIFNGVRIEFSSSNVFKHNTIINNHGFGFTLDVAEGNIIIENTVSQSFWDNFFLANNTYQNWIYHNNIYQGDEENAHDAGTNYWDNGYPSGGNYWDDYTGIDQNQDGIGDTPYIILGGDNQDRYPLMNPYGEEEPHLEITITGGYGVTITVKNIGENQLSDLDWNTDISGGILLLPLQKHKQGLIPSLAPDEQTKLRPAPFFFGYGQVTVTVTVEDITETTQGLLIFFFYYIRWS